MLLAGSVRPILVKLEATGSGKGPGGLMVTDGCQCGLCCPDRVPHRVSWTAFRVFFDRGRERSWPSTVESSTPWTRLICRRRLSGLLRMRVLQRGQGWNTVGYASGWKLFPCRLSAERVPNALSQPICSHILLSSCCWRKCFLSDVSVWILNCSLPARLTAAGFSSDKISDIPCIEKSL